MVFVRDDQPRSETCKQIALIRDEVQDLEKQESELFRLMNLLSKGFH
jgi:methionine synthase II (cobalamin-independent)